MKKILLLLILLPFFFTVVCFSQIKTFYANGSENVKKISLTFDDGPGQATEKILEILKRKNVKATFFMLGKRVHSDPRSARAVAAAGHEIANHTYSHINFYLYRGKDKIRKMEAEVLESEDVIKKETTVKPFLIRFPYGYAKNDAIKIAKKCGYYVINWSFGVDWEKITAREMHEKYKNSVKNGAIFLMHDLHENDKLLSFLGSFIDEIKEAGYEIVTVSELLNFNNKRF
jgi:peptidoglycan/xylan/chitin deacetylase (PgdA/CDA1 family)